MKMPKGAVEITQVMLHSAVIIAGKTETSLSKDRVPAIESLYWDSNGQYVRIHCAGGKIMQIPAAAVKQSLVRVTD